MHNAIHYKSIHISVCDSTVECDECYLLQVKYCLPCDSVFQNIIYKSAQHGQLSIVDQYQQTTQIEPQAVQHHQVSSW